MSTPGPQVNIDQVTWLEHAAVIWGEQWLSPMARAIGTDRRTVQRWRATEQQRPGANSQCPDTVRLALQIAARELRLVHRDNRQPSQRT